MDELTILKQKQPEIAQYLEEWRALNERRVFDFSDEKDQADFFEALQVMARHIAHVAQSASMTTIISVDGINTLYVNVKPTPSASS